MQQALGMRSLPSSGSQRAASQLEARRLAHRQHRAAAAAAASRPHASQQQPPPSPRRAAAAAASSPSSSPSSSPAVQRVLDGQDDRIVSWTWTGADEFSALGDRRDAPPLPLPRLAHSRRIVLVRHGQSTWNARNRIQGSSDFSVLTEKGVEQAQSAHAQLASLEFQQLFHSPLQRAAQTAEIVWGDRAAPALQLASLREIDLYSFQGLDKVESRSRYPEQYQHWQQSPHEFAIDSHWPVRELWYRASLAWQQVLAGAQGPGCSLVVAHNAVNQALLCTALGLPASFFRRFSQANAAFSVIDFEYGGSEDSGGKGGKRPPAAPRVRVERVNQFPDKPLSPGKLGSSQPNRLVLISGSATSAEVQASLSMVNSVGVTTPPLIGVGSAAQQALDIGTAVQAALSTPGEGRSVVAVASAPACQRLLGACIGPADPAASPEEQQRSAAEVGGMFCMAEGGITIVSWPVGQGELRRGTILCVNYQVPAGMAA